VFGLGVLVHLALHPRSYDVVHTASFPFFSLLAAALLRPLARFRLVVDWFEVWSLDYWREYLGRTGGRIGWLVQRACIHVRQHAFCFSDLHLRRLREQDLRGDAEKLEGMYDGPAEPPDPRPADPVVVFAGRHIPEKRVPRLVPAMERAVRRVPSLRCDIYGDGPDRAEVERLIRAGGLEEVVRARGFVDAAEVEEALSRATCMVLPSRREGYGLVVVESAARGTPSVVVADADNAAAELIEDGVNGVVAESADPGVLADAIVRVHEEGQPLRDRTAEWFAHNADRLSLERSLRRVVAGYAVSSR
jgi:glycosyltransferase involved in cell wall biosynthesis